MRFFARNFLSGTKCDFLRTLNLFTTLFQVFSSSTMSNKLLPAQRFRERFHVRNRFHACLLAEFFGTLMLLVGFLSYLHSFDLSNI